MFGNAGDDEDGEAEAEMCAERAAMFENYTTQRANTQHRLAILEEMNVSGQHMNMPCHVTSCHVMACHGCGCGACECHVMYGCTRSMLCLMFLRIVHVV